MDFPNASFDSTTCYQDTEFELAITRKRNLKPDNKGRYRPRIGHVRFKMANGESRVLRLKKEKRFNLGTDKKEAEIRYAKIQKLYEENCAVNGCNEWSPQALSYADEIAKGKRVIEFPPLSDIYADPLLEYSQMLEVVRSMYPSLDLVADDLSMYEASVQLNQGFVAKQLETVEKQLRELGAIGSTTSIPMNLMSGSLHEAFEKYKDHIERTGIRFESSKLKQSQTKRLARVERFKKLHADIPLYELNLDKCDEFLSKWKNRPHSAKGTPSSWDGVRHHIGELFRFWRWLNGTNEFGWIMPRGVEDLNRRIPKLPSEKKLAVITKPIYTPQQLGIINQHAHPLERLMLYLGVSDVQ